MKKILACIITILISFSAFAGDAGKAEVEVRAAMAAFNSAYANNDVKAYFSFYTADSVA